MILILWVRFVFFRSNKVFILINQFNNMVLNIEENTNVNVPAEYNISEGFFLRTRMLSINIFRVNSFWVSNLGEGKLQFRDFSVSIFNFCTQLKSITNWLFISRMKKVNKNIFFVCCTWKQNNRNGYENISQSKTTHLMFGMNVSTNFTRLQWWFFSESCHGN